jgi:cathepsin B
MSRLAVLCLFFGLLAVASALMMPECNHDGCPALDEDIIQYINSQDFGWKAGRNAKFEGLTRAQAKKFLGTKLQPKGLPTGYESYTEAEVIPASFDSRKNAAWSACKYIGHIRNQEQCGSCWAFGATESFSDRLCIATKAQTNVLLSPEDLVSCDTTNYGCSGGYLVLAWEFMASTGVVTDACFPYGAGSGTAPACTSTCANGQAWTPYLVENSTIVTPATVAAIQTEIMTNGPVEVAFTVYEDFFSYESGVYVHKSGGEAGGHAVKNVGWGVTSDGKNTPYWIIANSWGTKWGQLGGFFWILRGVDECGIESNVVAGLPQSS